MAANVPLVAAATSSLPEVVADGGLLVPPTPAGLAEGILAATSGTPDIARMVATGRRRAARFTWSASAEAHARVWASLI
jgi:glycosyltransferase involved in cell wall biosynthesis